MLFFVTPKICISIVFSFSWGVKMTPRETQNNACAKFWGDKQLTIILGKYSQSHYSPRLQRIIVLVYTHEVISTKSVQ